VVAAMRCRQCHAKPSAALLTNAREAFDIHAFLNLEKGGGHFQLVLWDDGARQCTKPIWKLLKNFAGR
jgi:hypothetical protein